MVIKQDHPAHSTAGIDIVTKGSITGGQDVTQRCLLLFLKAPEMGKVKTRLAETIGAEHACELYKHFIEDILETIGYSMHRGSFPLKICYYPPYSERSIAQWLGNKYHYMPQEGKDLGERMKNAFLKSFSAGFNHVVLLGSDIPDLPDKIISEAFDSLQDGDAIIGPSLDGGYYLIGFRSGNFHPEVFTSIPWSSDNVFQRTMELFTYQNLRVSILPSWRDIDTYEDLKKLSNTFHDDHCKASRTMTYLLHHDLIK